MKVSQLKKILENVDDDLVVVIDAFDHNYHPISYASVMEAHDHGDGTFGQYGGVRCEEVYGKKTYVFHIGE